MTPQEYIESGLLELYVSGAATPAEAQEAERMAAAHAEVRAALEQLQSDFEAYATMHAVTPDPALKEKIIGSLLSSSHNETKVIPLQPARSAWKIFAVAASVLLLMSVAGNFIVLRNMNALSDANRQLAGQLAQKDDSMLMTARSLAAMQARQDSLAHFLAFVRNPMTQNIALNSIVDGHPMKAMVHWDSQSKMVMVDPMTLPATAPDEKYVLWAIVDGKPVNEGGFACSDTTGMMMMPSAIPSAEAFAISLEKSMAVAAPAGPIYVMGKPAPAAP